MIRTNEDSTMAKTTRLFMERWVAPICPLLLVTDDDGIVRAIEFAEYKSRMERLLREHYGSNYTLENGAAAVSVKEALQAYFEGDLDALSAVRTATGGTPFQHEVWNALREIPAGTTISYGQLAAKIRRAGASRAVGAANGANPIPIVVPCHRVIGVNGTLTGYGGGLAHKKWLLEHEARFASIATRTQIPEYLV